MPRYVHPDGTSWSIEQVDKQLAIDAAGKPSLRKFVSQSHAEAQLAKLVAEKLAAGFVETALEAAPAAATVRNDDGLDPTLLAQCLDDPYDAQTFRVLGDALTERGDPRGELCARMVAAEAKTGKKARKLVAEWFDEYADELLGELADLFELGEFDDEPLVWKHGYIHRARLEYPGKPEVAALLAHPSSRFLAELEIVGAMPEIVDAIALRPPRALRILELHARRDIGDLSALWAGMPRLRRVRIQARSFEVGAIPGALLPAAERIEFSARILAGSVVRAVATAAWPNLERLSLRFGGFRPFQRNEPRPPGAATYDDLRPLLARTDLPRLTHLRLVRGFGAEAALDLAQRPIVAQLVSLDLAGSNLDDRAAFALAKAEFPKLRELVVSENLMTPAGSAALRGLCPSVVERSDGVLMLGDQLDTQEPIDGPDVPSVPGDDDDRYDEIDE